LVLPDYGVFDSAQDRHTPPPRDHLLVEMCRSAGLRGAVELKPLFRLNAREGALGRTRASGHVLVQSSSRGARISAINKEWSHESWQTVASTLRERFPVTQVGSAVDPPLHGVADQRGCLTLREVAACLAAARLFVGPEGFLMHLARAVDCRCVIVLGGRTSPHQTCYVENANLFTPLPCAPCWQRNTCAYDRECLRQISPADVLRAVATQLALPPLSSPGQTVML
jgi:ADP-heptose:LPS heptosyltransferase